MTVQCTLCPKGCLIKPGQSGECRIRVNLDGRLLAVTYGRPCALNLDPIEKKPLFHFLPGSSTFSLATAGCNLHCKNCQNWQISQGNPEHTTSDYLPPEHIPALARRNGCRSVSYTYTEPLVYYEYTRDASIRVRDAGLRNVLVTAGYINRKPMEELARYTDAANIDLKAFSDAFYRDVCGATLQPVLDTLVLSKERGVHVEVTNLIIPTLNDSEQDLTNLCRWMAAHMGKDTPLHFSRFHPDYRMKNLPPTPAETLDRAKAIAQAEGILFVYIGNILRPDGETTFCPGCKRPLVTRRGFTVIENAIQDGRCPGCRQEIPGIWS